MSKFEKIITLTPAYDKRHKDPSKNYGIHGVNLLMVLKGEKGAVNFTLYTNWQLPHVTEEMLHDSRQREGIELFFMPMPVDLGYHSYTPTYEGQEPITNSCEYLNGKPCYYDGSGLNAQPIYEVLLNEGSDGVWRELENYYNEMFGG